MGVLPNGVRLKAMAETRPPRHSPPSSTDSTGTPTYHQNDSHSTPPSVAPAIPDASSTVIHRDNMTRWARQSDGLDRRARQSDGLDKQTG